MNFSGLLFRLAGPLTAILLISCAGRTRDAQERAELHLRIGTALLSQGKYPAALGELLVAQELDPKNPVIYNHLALAYFVRERYDLAEHNVKEALRLKPDYTEARNNLGRILIERQQFDAALTELNRALEDLTYPETHQIQLNIAYAYFLKMKHRESLELLEKVLRIDRKNCFGLTLMGKNYFKLQQLSKASEALDSAIRSCPRPNQGEALFFAGKAYYHMKEFKQASARFDLYLARHQEETHASEARKLNNLIEQRLSQ